MDNKVKLRLALAVLALVATPWLHVRVLEEIYLLTYLLGCDGPVFMPVRTLIILKAAACNFSC